MHINITVRKFKHYSPNQTLRKLQLSLELTFQFMYWSIIYLAIDRDAVAPGDGAFNTCI